jgi:hypothetical protein
MASGFLGPAWRRDCRIAPPRDVVSVELVPEGVQRGDLAADFAAALADELDAGEFFDSLASATSTERTASPLRVTSDADDKQGSVPIGSYLA